MAKDSSKPQSAARQQFGGDSSTQGPTCIQKLSVATYIYFIPFFIVCNLLCFTNKYSAVLWFLYTIYINLGPGRWASKNGSWPKLCRKLGWWKHCADYFPTELIKTADLDPEQRYIFVVAPHGVVTMFCWPCFDTDATDFSKKFPGIDIHPMTLEINFKIPFMREFLLLHGVVDASKSACLMTLGKGSGQAILLAVGGAQESLLARPGTYDIVLAKRKGFVRIALQTGAQLVPVIGFGENELYHMREVKPGSMRDKLQRFLKAAFGFTLPNAVGTGLFFGSGLMPFKRPLHTVVGAPVEFDPSAALKDYPEAGLDQLVDAYHAQYVAALKQLWNEHKDKYDSGRRKSLDIVE
ncbi:diacylglycerol acyltransferase [Scenedesmus sp. NREL 46B-D3]|nr:diacylglycerol acyltransferase [Scenedesmus sp. NREL 46B-D3]